jgi:hypothetical protein
VETHFEEQSFPQDRMQTSDRSLSLDVQ